MPPPSSALPCTWVPLGPLRLGTVKASRLRYACSPTQRHASCKPKWRESGYVLTRPALSNPDHTHPGHEHVSRMPFSMTESRRRAVRKGSISAAAPGKPVPEDHLVFRVVGDAHTAECQPAGVVIQLRDDHAIQTRVSDSDPVPPADPR